MKHEVNGTQYNFAKDSVFHIPAKDFDAIESLSDALSYLARKDRVVFPIDRVDHIEYDTTNGKIMISDRGLDTGNGPIDSSLLLVRYTK